MSKKKKGKGRSIVEHVLAVRLGRHQEPLVEDRDPEPVTPGETAGNLHARMAELDESAAGIDEERAAVRYQIDQNDSAVAQKSIENRRLARCYWPEDQPIPGTYIKRKPIPCPKCRRVLLDTNARAVSCLSSGSAVAFFRCRACEHRWQLPVKEI